MPSDITLALSEKHRCPALGEEILGSAFDTKATLSALGQQTNEQKIN